MYPELEDLADRAEERYLTEQEMAEFKRHTTSLAQRLEVYETLRDRELEIFQPIADRLEAAFPDEEQTTLEQALIHWLSVLRYSAMAMLANNKDFLRSQLYAWFQGTIQVRNLQAIESELYQLLQARLREILAEPSLSVLQPFLEFAKAILLDNAPLALETHPKTKIQV